MKLDVTFRETDQHFQPDFGEVFNVSDGGFERGYDAGYAKGETAGYTKGYGEGETAGYNQGNSDGYETGYTKGNSDGYANGYETGYAEGAESVEMYIVPTTGVMYIPHFKHITGGLSANHQFGTHYAFATELISYETDLVGNGYCFTNKTFQGCTKLKTVIFSRLNQIMSPIDNFYGCASLESVQFGSVGYPMWALSDGRMLRGTSHRFQLTIYVDANTIAEIPTAITNSAPWGNPNVEIIYRNSTTGEVITE